MLWILWRLFVITTEQWDLFAVELNNWNRCKGDKCRKVKVTNCILQWRMKKQTDSYIQTQVITITNMHTGNIAKPTSKHYCQKTLCEVNVSNYTILKQYTASPYGTTKYRHDANQLHWHKYNIVKVWVTNSLQQFYLFLFILLFYHQINYSSYKKLSLFVVCVADKMLESYLNKHNKKLPTSTENIRNV